MRERSRPGFTRGSTQNTNTVQKKKGPTVGGLAKDSIAQLYSKDKDKKQSSKPTVSDSRINLPSAVQAKMENSFGTDFSNVNIHQGESATQLNALAYTQGNDIHFAPGQYNPESKSGQELLGHELTHVVQQRQGNVVPTTQMKGVGINDDKGLEKEADEMGKMASEGGKVHVNGTTSSNTIQRKDSDTASFTHTVQKGESIDLIVTKYFGNLMGEKLWEYKSQIMNLNDIYDESQIKSGDILLIPETKIEQKNINGYVAHGNGYIIKNEESKNLSFSNVNILGTCYWTSYMGTKKETNALALTEAQWIDLMKNGLLDDTDNYKYFAKGFIQLALGENITEVDVNSESGKQIINTPGGAGGWVISRRPNVFEITNFLKALYHPDVDLMNHYGEYSEISGTDIGTITMLPEIGKFVAKYQGLLVELDSRRNLQKGAPYRETKFTDKNINAFAEQSYTGSGTKDVMNGALTSAYITLGKGILTIESADMEKDTAQIAIGNEMMLNSLNIIKRILYEYDDYLNLQKSIVVTALNAVPYKSKIGGGEKKTIIDQIANWLVFPDKYESPKSRLLDLQKKIRESANYLQGQNNLSPLTVSYILAQSNTLLSSLD